jgi:hypothetical protein
MTYLRGILAAALSSILLAATPAAGQGLAGKKVLFVNSYHEGYEWSDGIEKGVRTVLGSTGVQLRFHRMDTKRHGDEASKKAAGQKARAEIESWKPDAVILSDDNAVQYVYVAFYKDSKIPFVFCGVNWDASKYGLPAKNSTGMLEVALVKEIIDNLKGYAKGSRIGFLTVDTETERVEGPWYTKQLGIEFATQKYVKTLAEWKESFARMQGEVDVLLLGNFAGINDWNEKDAAAFALANTRVPSGAMYDFMMPYAMLGLVKVPEEQGIWAAKATTSILKGASPGSIPVARNKEGRTMLNVKLASKASVVFKPELLRNAEVLK